VTDVNSEFVAELVRYGLDRREATWLVEEFVPGADPDAVVALRLSAQRRMDGEPIQYIIGHWPFRSLDLDVDSRVLIPRPETEELVGIAMGELARSRAAAPLIVDLGCGSGAIGLALVSELGERGVVATLVCVDESDDALAVARRNALKHHLHAASFVRSTWYRDLDASLAGHVDLIVANPPYVGAAEFEGLDPVLTYEPRDAIVAPDARGVAGFADLELIIEGALRWLAPGGMLICEHSNAHREAATSCATSAGFASVEDFNDMAGHPRVMVARRA
jgi:release factor glutamine methyltransferase